VVGTRILRKRICVRFEHVKASRCRELFLAKQKAYKEYLVTKKAGKTEATKKVSRRAGGIVRTKSVEILRKRAEDFDTYLPY
jgi:large subunit ribosomal protein L21e